MTTDVVDSVPAELLHKEIKGLGVSHILIVPDTHQRTLLTSLMEDESLTTVTFSTEQEVICCNAGMWMGGMDALVVIQNVGIFAALNAVRGMAMDLKVPTCMLVGQYARDVTKTVEDNANSAVRLIESVLKTMDIPTYIIDRADDVGVLATAYAQSRAERRPTVVLVGAPTC